jgi:hypothetical protein
MQIVKMTDNLQQAVTAPPPHTLERSSSPELGSPSKMIQYNKHTGRPVRRNAGRAKRGAGYVDSSKLEEVDDDEPSTSESSEDEDMEKRSRANKLKRKRKRSPSPPTPHLEPLIYNQELDKLTDDESGGDFHRKTLKKPPVTLQFNVPLGFHGPLFVKLDSALLKDNEDGTRHDMRRVHNAHSNVHTAKAAHQTADVAVPSRSFTTLPPELRNLVYQYLFVRDQTLRIPQRPGNPGLSQSAQFLRTCKLVHDEGCSVSVHV